MRILIKTKIIILFIFLFNDLYAQNKELKFKLDSSGSEFIKVNFTAQLWGRYTDNNPGTTVFGYEKKQGFDIGLRRVRTQLFGKLNKNVFFYTQFGVNNFNSISARKSPLFFHDVVAEYYVTPKSFHLGAGLAAWSGLARFSSPSVAGIMGYDAPLFQQSTNDANDQFLRKLSVYAKGKISKLDYRIILSEPMAVQNSSVVLPISLNSDFAFTPPEKQIGTYLMWQFLDQESDQTPYLTGTYLGKKNVLNIGAGVQYQPDAMWRWSDPVNKDTVFSDMMNYAIDVFYDHPLGKNGSAISAYASYVNFDFGKNYLRNLGVMNPANGTNTAASFNGPGNAFPMIGTGQVIFAQLGYLLPESLLKNGQLQPYVMFMNSDFQRLKGVLQTYDLGLNWYIDGARSKLSFDYQLRPIISPVTLTGTSKKGMFVIQYQIAI